MNCPSCGASIIQHPDTEGFQCAYCHTVFFPDEDGDGVVVSNDPTAPAAAELCPLCSQALVHAQVSKTPVLFCKQCQGVLMAMNALPGLVEQIHNQCEKPAVQAAPDRHDLNRALRCPRCGQRMDTHFYAGPGNVIVDSCANCFLLWLDRGELTRIGHAPEEGDLE